MDQILGDWERQKVWFNNNIKCMILYIYILGYISNIDGKKNLVLKGLINKS